VNRFGKFLAEGGEAGLGFTVSMFHCRRIRCCSSGRS